MIRIWLTEYSIDPITGLGTMCGPNIESPAEMIAVALAAKIAKENPEMHDLRVMGWLSGTVQTKGTVDDNDPSTWDPDWTTYVDIENIWMN